MIFEIYKKLLILVLKVSFVAGGFSSYYQASQYYKVKAGKAMKKGLVSQKAIHESFYGKRNYTKYQGGSKDLSMDEDEYCGVGQMLKILSREVKRVEDLLYHGEEVMPRPS